MIARKLALAHVALSKGTEGLSRTDWVLDKKGENNLPLFVYWLQEHLQNKVESLKVIFNMI